MTWESESHVLVRSGLSKRYGDVVALNGSTFTVRLGRITGSHEPNGAGKTTAMRSVFGLAQAIPGSLAVLALVIEFAKDIA